MSEEVQVSEMGRSGSDFDQGESDSSSFGWGSFGPPPEDWRVERVQDLFQVEKTSIDPAKLSDQEEVNLYSMPAFDEGVGPELTPSVNIGSKKFRVPPHTLLFPKLNLFKKRFWLVDHNHSETALCSTEYWPLVPKGDINLEFYLQYFNADSFISRPRLSTASSTNSHQRVRWSLFQRVRLPVPPLEEQRKIASVLCNIDQAIENCVQREKQYSRVFSGLTEDLLFDGAWNHEEFSESTYGSFPSSWETASLKEVCKQIQAGGTPSTSNGNYYGGSIPWVKTGELSQRRVRETEETITEAGLKNSTARLFDPGTVLVAMYGATTGEVAYLEIEAATNQACCGIVPGDQLDSEFLYYQLRHLSPRLKALSVGSGQQNIGKGILQKLDVLIPPLEEQQEIVQSLRGLESAKTQTSRTRSQLQVLKKGLRQDLLSGEVRTHDKDIDVLPEVKRHG